MLIWQQQFTAELCTAEEANPHEAFRAIGFAEAGTHTEAERQQAASCNRESLWADTSRQLLGFSRRTLRTRFFALRSAHKPPFAL